jgi:chemotaxis family two-component system response regulator Rcp1
LEILLVEDNPADIRLFQEVCFEESLPHRVSIAVNGEDALDFLRRRSHYGDATRPDVVLLDLNLPIIDGHQVLRTMKADPELKTIPVIVFSSSHAPSDIKLSYEENAACYIRKPSNLADFVHVFRALENFWFSVVTLPDTEEVPQIAGD